MQWTLKSATTADEAFLYALHRKTLREAVERRLAWDEAAQREDFAARLAVCDVFILRAQGRAVGGLWLEWLPDRLHLHELQILPELQGKALGTAAIQEFMQRAEERGLPVDLSVVPSGPRAQALYERLGFAITAVDPPFVRMRHSSPGLEAIRQNNIGGET